MSYKGSVTLISGITQKSGDFPLVDSTAVRVTDDKRLNTVLDELSAASGNVDSKISDAIEDLDSSVSAATNKFITGITQTDGKIASITEKQPASTDISDFDTAVDDRISGKQDKLTAGEGISITNNVISATGAVADAVTDVKVDNTSVVTSGVANINLTGKQDKLTAGTGISIANNVISSTSTGDVADVKLDGTSIVDANKVANININADTLVHISDQSASAATPTIDADTLDGHDSNYFSVKSESVLNVPQTMSVDAQAQARANLGIVDNVQTITTGVTTLNGAQGNITVNGANLPVGSESASVGSIKEALNEIEQKVSGFSLFEEYLPEKFEDTHYNRKVTICRNKITIEKTGNDSTAYCHYSLFGHKYLGSGGPVPTDQLTDEDFISFTPYSDALILQRFTTFVSSNIVTVYYLVTKNPETGEIKGATILNSGLGTTRTGNIFEKLPDILSNGNFGLIFTIRNNHQDITENFWIKTTMRPVLATITNNVLSTYNANKAYAVGDMLFVAGTLYRATTAIANGEQLIPNTNIAKITIEEQFNELTEDVDNFKSQIYYEIPGDPDDFINGYVSTGGSDKGHIITGSTVTIMNKCFLNSRDVLTVKANTGYLIMTYVYSLTKSSLLGYINSSGEVATSGSIKYFTVFNLKDYSSDYLFRFGIVKMDGNTRVEITPEDAVNALFVQENHNFLSGYKLSVMGDSISTFTGYTTPGAPDAYYPLKASFVEYVQNMYWKILSRNTGLTIDTIDAYGGSTVGTKWQDTVRVPFIDESRLSRLGTPDVIIVQGGINDFGGNPLGEYPIDGSYTNLYEFRTAYAYLIDQLKQRYKKAIIVCLSMIGPRTYNNSVFPEKQTEVKQALSSDKTTHYFYEFNDAISEICKRYECVFCNITDIVNYYLNPTSTLGPHWHYNAHIGVAKRIEEKLKEIWP